MRVAFLVFAFSLSAPAFSADKPIQAGVEKDKLICRREVPVGSLIASRKICLTKADWSRRAEDGNEEARRLYDRGGRCNGLGTAC